MQPERTFNFQDFLKPTFLQLVCSKVDTCPTPVFTRKDDIACYCKKHNNLTQFKSDSFELHEKKQINKPPKKKGYTRVLFMRSPKLLALIPSLNLLLN
jgi:hypothetical protein